MPRIRLTKSAIDALPTSQSDVVYWDAGCPGFGVKVTPKGRKVFIVLYRTGGAGSKLRKYTIGPYGRVTLHQARVAAQKVFAAKLEGRDPAAEKRESKRRVVADRVEDLLESYIAQRLSQNRSGGEIARLLRREAGRAWTGKSVHEIGKRDVVELISAIEHRGAPIAANKTLKSIKTFFCWCVGRASNNTARRFMVRAWNACAAAIDGRPLRRLTEPPIKVLAKPAWDAFPAGLRRNVGDYFASLAKPHRSLNGKHIQPCSSGTIETRRAELVAMARMAVRLGVSIESLTSLGALLHPDVVERVVDAYWQRNGDEPKTGTIDLGWKVLRMARETGCLDQGALDRLDEMRVALEHHRREGLTSKNLQLVRQVLTDGVWSEVVSLPNVLMQHAHSAKDHAPIKAAISARLAVAVAILTFAPVRLSNLVSIELGQNLIKPGGPNTPYWLVFPHYDVKNRIDLNFKFDQDLTDLIDEYVQEFRPALLRGSNASWLFPGEAGKPKVAITFSLQITRRIQKAVGLRITVHQFRHAAAAIYLKHRPGDYEFVRRFLGHRDIQTTIRFYCGLETMQATEDFGKLIRQQIKFDPIDA